MKHNPLGDVMAVIKNLRRGFYLKSRPAAYESDGMTVGGNRGWVIASLPKAYPKTSQQRKIANVARECGIHKGITRSALRKAMIECVGPKLRKQG